MESRMKLFGHPVHPMLIVFPLGLLGMAVIFDVVHMVSGNLLIVTRNGEAGDAHPLSGFDFREARLLSTCRIEINGHRPWLCEAAAPAPDRLQFVLGVEPQPSPLTHAA